MDSLNISSDVGAVLGCCGEERSFLFKSYVPTLIPGHDIKVMTGRLR